MLCYASLGGGGGGIGVLRYLFGGMEGLINVFSSCHVDQNGIKRLLIKTVFEIPSNSLFISSRRTRNQILNIKLIITTTIIMMILIIIMYFTTLEHLKAGIKGEELLLPRHTVIWMCLWAKETLIWLSQKLELYRFHFHFCKLANNLTGFVNKYTKK